MSIIFKCSAAQKDCLQSLKLLIEGKANAGATTKDRFTPVYIASSHNNQDCLKMLLDADADPSVVAKRKFVPIYIASQKNSKECLELLIAGVNPSRQIITIYTTS